MGTAAATAVLIRREKEMVAAFRARGAIDSGSAVTLESLNLHRGIAFQRLRGHAVIRDAGAERYYLDELSWEAVGRMRRRLASVVVVVLVVLIAAGVITLK